MDLNCIICEITKKTFEVIQKVYDYHQEYVDPQKRPKIRRDMKSLDIGSRILFPRHYIHKKRNTKKENKTRKDYNRISEQELRFIFVEQLNKYADQNNIDIYYSLETPTKNVYIFSSENNDAPKVDNENGISARTDLAIYKKIGTSFRKEALIEFKALNPDIENYKKDFCKLNEEECKFKYFIQIIKNYDNGTIKSIRDKIKNNGNNINYKCYCLDRGEDITRKITDKSCESQSTAE